jgi:hypothetical protein
MKLTCKYPYGFVIKNKCYQLVKNLISYNSLEIQEFRWETIGIIKTAIHRLVHARLYKLKRPNYTYLDYSVQQRPMNPGKFLWGLALSYIACC